MSKKQHLIEYAVTNKQGGKIRCIEAPNGAAALRIAASDQFAVTIPTRAEMYQLAKDGVEIEFWANRRDDPSQPELDDDGVEQDAK
jgi:hypothetical protein